MDLGRKNSITDVKDPQNDVFWVPLTPLKHPQPKPQPICANEQENQQTEENPFETERISQENQLVEEDLLESDSPPGFSRQSEKNGVFACPDPTDSINVTGGFENWGAGLAMNPRIFDGNGGVYNKFSVGSTDKWNMTFGDLLALANANVTQQGSVGTSDRVPDAPQCGSLIPSRVACDPNSPPRTTRDADLIRITTPQFAPFTPDQVKRAENKQVSDTQSTSADERINQPRDVFNNEVADTRVEVRGVNEKEQSSMPEESSCAAVCTQLEENHNPDIGENQGIDLNKTPQQKPRRRKHRPKVVTEGKPKRARKPRTPKPAIPNETPTGKRKYVRRKGLDKSSSTPSVVGGTGGSTAQQMAENAATTPSVGVIGGSTEPKIAENTEKTCRRSLNFDFEVQTRNEGSSPTQPPSNLNSESQAQNFCPKSQLKSAVQLGQGIEVTGEKTQMGIAHDLTPSINQEFEDFVSMCERQTQRPSTPTKADPLHEKLKDEPTRGKCRIVFLNETHDKHEHTLQESPNDSNCSSSACMTQGEQVRGQKRAHSCTINEAQLSNVNATGMSYNSLQAYMFPVIDHSNPLHYMHIPALYKKKRTDKGQSSTTSSMVSTVTASENSMRQSTTYHLNNACFSSFAYQSEWRVSTAQFNPRNTQTEVSTLTSTQNNQQTSACMMALNEKERLTTTRSKGQNQVRDLASVVGIVEYQQRQTFPTTGVPISGNNSEYDTSQRPHTCMEAVLAETHPPKAKKRRRNSRVSSVPLSSYDHLEFFAKLKGPYSDVIWRNMFAVDAIVEQLKQLKINGASKQIGRRQQKALVPYKRRYKEQNALVLYQMDGTLIPFEGLYKKRKPRAKVDLDEETSRVWKLLLENINSEGIDGTDEEKARWWEEERKVFHGRADSFIARMHLVQGDRRFSPWKGSVVDSVVGVFLTQNVSDHLSSSAFMSLAARFPIKSKRNYIPCTEDGNGIWVEEPDVCILEPEDTIKWHEEKSNQPVSDQSSMTLQDGTNNEEKVVNSNETLRINTCEVRLTNISKGKFVESSGNDQQTCNASATVANLVEDEKEMDDVLSSQNSNVSSQNSVDSSTVPLADGIGSCSQSKSEDLTTRCTTQRLGGSTSFMELLHMAGNTAIYGVHKPVTANMPPSTYEHNQAKSSGYGVKCIDIEEGIFSNTSKIKEGNYTSKQSGLTTDSVNQVKVQETLTVSFEEALPSSNIIQGEVNKHLQSQSVPAKKPKNSYGSQTQDHSRQMQQVINLEVTESNTVTDNRRNTGKTVSEINPDTSKGKRVKTVKEKLNEVEWDGLRKEALENGKRRERTSNTQDSVDWEAVRCVHVNEIADAIKERGMNNMLAERIQDFLNRIVRDHGSIDLEWLRDVPPDKAKEYLLSVRGLGLKSVECVRLLTLHHLAFPVDTNVGRIAVRLGWVPLQPLPESLQLHLLELYPVLESIQKYLWPRLCKLDQRTLYELHYQMITFGKVFCTKSKPNCNACPMRGECRHFASAFASARLALPGPEDRSIVCAVENKAANPNPMGIINPLQLPMPPANQEPEALCGIKNHEPIIEEPASPEPIIEIPSTPEPEHPQLEESNIEDISCEDPEEIPTIKLNIEEFTQNLQHYMQHNMELQEGDVSKALVALTNEAASIPMPKLKYLNRLRTEHQVYELPDSHPLLEGLDNREPDDPCSYLLAIWTPGETADSIQPPERRCSSQDYNKLCDEETCFSCNSIREANSQTVRGTLLIPCRTAMRGSFPLNGTYFQVNEVFADHDSSINPIDVPRSWIWNLPRRTVYFGTSIPTIFKGLSTEGIQYCFWRGFVCVRGFDQKTRAPRPLLARLHFPASKLTRPKDNTDDK